MATYNVSSGVISNGLTLNSSDFLTVFNGGVVNNTRDLGGTDVVSSGGQAIGTVLSGGGTEYVYSGGVASGAVVSSLGTQQVYPGGTAGGTTVRSGGAQYVNSGGVAVAAVVSGGGSEYVDAGGTATGTTLTGGSAVAYQYVFGTASSTQIASGGVEQVFNGGQATGSVISSGGVEYLWSSGGVASGSVAESGGAIDISYLPFSTSGTVSLNTQTDVLTVVESGRNYTQQLAGTYAGESFQLSADSGTGTLVKVTGTLIPPPTVASVVASPAAGDVATGSLVTLTVTMTSAVTVAGGVPSLTLNDGGTATYDAAKSAGAALVFDYTVGSGDRTTALAVTGFSANGATIQDNVGNNAVLSGAPTSFGGLGVNVPPPAVSSVLAAPASGNELTGTLLTLTVVLSAPVTVAGGTPSLTLNDGGTATYDAGKSSGTALVFDYTVASGQSTPALAVTAFNANNATVLDQFGNAAVFSGALTTFNGLQVNVAAPAVASVTTSPATGDAVTGTLVLLTVTMTRAVTVTGGAPSLTLNDGGTATYDAARSSDGVLIFDYTVQSGQSAAALAVTGFSANGATIQDSAGNVAVFSGVPTTFNSLEVNVSTPIVASVVAAPATGDLLTGTAATLTVTMTNAVTVSGGSPSLTLNDGGTATYDAAKSGGTALVFDYAVASGQSTAALAVTGLNANGATIQDSGGENALFTALATTFSGLEVNIAPATVTSVVASPAAGDVVTGAAVTLTVTMSAAVTVVGGTPSLSLNDGGTATYDATKSSGAALVFDYTVADGQSTTGLAVTGLNSNGATIQDAGGTNAVVSGAATTFGNLQVNVATLATIGTAWSGILRVTPTSDQINTVLTQIQGGQTTLAQFETGLITGEQAIWSSLPALVTIDAFYNATPSSATLTTVAAASSGTSFYTATELHNLGYSDPNVWTILGAGWGADQNSAFFKLYSGDATGNTAGYTAFINAVYQKEFGFQPASANLQNLLGDIPGLSALLSGGGNVASQMQVMGGLYGYLLYVGQSYGIGHFAAAADAFLQAAASGTVAYGPELTQQFPPAATGTSATAATASADPSVISVTSPGQLIDPGAGDYTIQFLAGASDETLVPHLGFVDQVSGFDPASDVLDLRALLSEAGVSLAGDVTALSHYLTIADQGGDALLRFDPTGQGGSQGGGSPIAVLHGLGSSVTGLDTLVARGALRIA